MGAQSLAVSARAAAIKAGTVGAIVGSVVTNAIQQTLNHPLITTAIGAKLFGDQIDPFGLTDEERPAYEALRTREAQENKEAQDQRTADLTLKRLREAEERDIEQYQRDLLEGEQRLIDERRRNLEEQRNKLEELDELALRKIQQEILAQEALAEADAEEIAKLKETEALLNEVIELTLRKAELEKRQAEEEEKRALRFAETIQYGLDALVYSGLRGFEDLEDGFKAFIRSIAQELLQTNLTKPLSQELSKLFSGIVDGATNTGTTTSTGTSDYTIPEVGPRTVYNRQLYHGPGGRPEYFGQSIPEGVNTRAGQNITVNHYTTINMNADEQLEQRIQRAMNTATQQSVTIVQDKISRKASGFNVS